MATISDVAKRAGVSASTVSGVMNNTIKVKPETMRRIQRAIKELNYQPHAMARGLRTKRPNAWGLLIPSIDNPYYPAVARGVEDTARSKGYSVFICNTDHDRDQEEAYLNSLVSQASGVILTDMRVGQESIQKLLSHNVEVVVVNPEAPMEGVHSISIDYPSGSVEAVKHLIDFGHRHIGYVAGPSRSWRFRERLRGYRLGLDSTGIPFDENLVVAADLTANGGRMACRELLNRSPRPTAIMFANDFMAIGGLSAITDAGLKVPKDISIVGFDDISLLDHVRPPMTTVYQPSYELGQVAAGCLLSTEQGYQSRRLLTHLVARESTYPVNR